MKSPNGGSRITSVKPAVATDSGGVLAPARVALQRKCACGGTPGPDGECAACKARRLGLQRRALGAGAPAMTSSPAVAPPIVHEVLRAPGQPLDAATRAYMEPRFGHDFGQVRVHSDARAAESARAVNALAYTVGQDMAFGTGQYMPATPAGRRLLAHELAHTVQQGDGIQRAISVGDAHDPYEQEADRVTEQVTRGDVSNWASAAGSMARGVFGTLMRQVAAPTAPAMVGVPLQTRNVEEPAGGCGLCMGPQLAGLTAHQLIQGAFQLQVPGGLTELRLLPSPGDDTPNPSRPRLDLAIFITPSQEVQIGEIKPANKRGTADGKRDITFYSDHIRLLGLNPTPLTIPITLQPVGAIIDPTVPGCPSQSVFVNPPQPGLEGVYTYFCDPTRREIQDENPDCRCGADREASVVVGVIALLLLAALLRRVPIPRVPVPVPEVPPKLPVPATGLLNFVIDATDGLTSASGTALENALPVGAGNLPAEPNVPPAISLPDVAPGVILALQADSAALNSFLTVYNNTSSADEATDAQIQALDLMDEDILPGIASLATLVPPGQSQDTLRTRLAGTPARRQFTSPLFRGDAVLAACLNGERLLRDGDADPAVRKVQQALLDLGFGLPQFGVDGEFGAETTAAVRRFQAASGLTPDGIIGPLTMNAMDRSVGP